MSSTRQSSRSRSSKRRTQQSSEAPRMNGFGISESARMFGGSTLMTEDSNKLNLSKEKLLLDDSNKSGNSAAGVGGGGGGVGGGGGERVEIELYSIPFVYTKIRYA